MPEPTPTRIRAYIPSDEKQVRFMVGQAQMESLAFANSSSEQSTTFFLIPEPSHADRRPTYFIQSVLASGHSGRVDMRFFRVRSLHGLVAKFHTRNLELATAPPGIFRPGRANNVLG